METPTQGDVTPPGGWRRRIRVLWRRRITNRVVLTVRATLKRTSRLALGRAVHEILSKDYGVARALWDDASDRVQVGKNAVTECQRAGKRTACQGVERRSKSLIVVSK